MIYLDYAASTPVDPGVLEAMQVAMTVQGNYANPSSTHSAGWRCGESSLRSGVPPRRAPRLDALRSTTIAAG